MLELTRTDDSTAAVRTKIIGLVKARARARERYAALHNRARTQAAHDLIARIRDDMEQLEQQGKKRLYRRGAIGRAKFTDAIERFVGDLLRVQAGTKAPALVFRSIGKSCFDDDPVKYETFTNVLNGLKALELIGHQSGRTRFRKSEFDPGEFVSTSLPGRASRFWPTSTLLRLAARYGIDTDNVCEHFAPEPPMHPVVLKDYAGGRGKKKIKGGRVKFKDTPESARIVQDVRELNQFLAGVKLTGGEHEGYIRVFHNRSWKKGGRLYSVGGPHGYQQMPEKQRHKMTINSEPVAEIDIKASQLTIYHAMVGEPLEGSSDPYARAGIDRWTAKKWVVVSFGNGAPCRRWPAEALDDYEDHRQEHKQKTGVDLPNLPKASQVARTMLEAFPALKKLGHDLELWAHLQYREATAVIGTMLILMRTHNVRSLSMHDGLIVPKSKAELAKGILTREFRRVIGVAPMLTVEPEEPVVDDL
jgi:hypothetical protein